MTVLRDLPQKKKMSILAGVLLAMLLGALDSTIVGPAMPKIVQELGGMSLLAWVFTIYSLTSTIAIPIVGKLSDLYGRKWFFLAGIMIFLAGSALSGASGEAWINSVFAALTGAANPMIQLIVFRGLQGIGGGMMMANAMAIIGDLFEPRERARYQGLTGATFGLASVFGPMAGGWLTDSLTWRWIFYINVPFGVLALVVLMLWMPKPETGQQHRVDWWGATALAAGLVPLLLALSWGGGDYAWTSPTILGLFAAAAVMLALFVARELRASEPILDIRLFKDGSFTASMSVLFLSGVGMYGSIMFLPTFMQLVQGRSASSSGALLTPMMLAFVGGSIMTGQIIARTGKYKFMGIGGLAVASAGMFALTRLSVSSSQFFVAACMLLVGVGIGVTLPLFTISLQSQFRDRIGEVTAAMQFFRNIGGTVGVALLGGVMNARMRTALADKIGSGGVPQLKMLWATSPQPGPFSDQGMQALLKQFASKLPTGGAQIFTDFVSNLKIVVNGNIPKGFDPSSVLNTEMLATVGKLVHGIEAQMPAAMVKQLGLSAAWTTLAGDLKFALTAGVTHAFFYGAVLLVVAFFVMFLVREVPLTAKPHLDTAAEIGAEILAEEAVQPSDHEPLVVGDGDGRDSGEVERGVPADKA
ncbi:MAG TPA: MDR family MFS transporter [Coriobacteriia bacterium]|nr:MDR family MFS transporter [Coriobacteriia bacterium]